MRSSLPTFTSANCKDSCAAKCHAIPWRSSLHLVSALIWTLQHFSLLKFSVWPPQQGWFLFVPFFKKMAASSSLLHFTRLNESISLVVEHNPHIALHFGKEYCKQVTPIMPYTSQLLTAFPPGSRLAGTVTGATETNEKMRTCRRERSSHS